MSAIGRRDLFRIVGTAGAAAGLDACSDIIPETPIRPWTGAQHVKTTVCGACPAGCGIAVRTVGDDAVRISGVAAHPVSDGGLCPRGLAEVQELYHPERLHAPVATSGARGSGTFGAVSWADALAKVEAQLKGPLVFGVGVVSPLERLLIERLAARTGAQLVAVGLHSEERPLEAFELFHGTPELTFDLAQADFVLTIGSDWLQASESPVEAQRTYATLRSTQVPTPLATADARMSTTAARSSDWLPVRSRDLPFFTLVLARAAIDADGTRAARLPEVAAIVRNDAFALDKAAARLDVSKRSLQNVVDRLHRAKHPVVVADRSASLMTQVAAVALQIFLDGAKPGLIPRQSPPVAPAVAGPPVTWTREVPVLPTPATVLLFNANPVHVEPRSGWLGLLQNARFVAAVAPHLDETARHADVVLPASTALESRHLVWGATLDGAPFVTAGPAVVKPLYDTIEKVELLVRLTKSVEPALAWTSADDLFAALARAFGVTKELKDGGALRPTMPPPVAPALLATASARAAELLQGIPTAATARPLELELQVFAPIAFAGGLGAHLPYLHGLAGAGGREAWRTIVELHPQTAARFGITDRSPVAIESAQGTLRGTAFLRQGIRPDTVAVPAGLGRRALGTWADGWGDNPLTLTSPGSTVAVTIRRA